MLKSAAPKRLLLIEDDELLSRALTESLVSQGYQVDALATGEGIPRMMERNSVNLIILDIQLPGKDGLYWLKWFKSYYPSVPVILVSSRVQPEERVEGLQAGAHDYLVKPFHDQELLIKVQYFLKQGKTHQETHQAVIKIGDFTLDTINNVVIKNGFQTPLTELECKILQLLHMNAGMPLSREELMWQTMGIRYVPSNRSIDTHINRLRKKIEDAPANPTYIRTVRGRGYCFYLPNTATSAH